jgi:WD40 repeat protein
LKRGPSRLPRCLGCGFVAMARTEYCPECGLRHPRGRMEPMVKPFLPQRAETCLRAQSQQIDDQQARVVADIDRLDEVLANLRMRVREAEGRDTRLLSASLDGVQAALAQRRDLLVRLHALQADIALERIESEIALLGEQLLEAGGVQPVLTGTFDENSAQGAVRLLHAHPTGGLVACVYERGPVRLLDLDTLRWCGELPVDSATVSSIAFASVHQMVALAHDDATVSLWDHASSRMLGRASCAGARPVGLGWHPGAQRLSAACADGSVLTWEVPSLTPSGTFRVQGGISAFAIDPSGRWIAAACNDVVVSLVVPSTGEPLRALEGHAGRVIALAVEPQGRWIASQDDTGEARVWRQDATGSVVQRMRRSKMAALCFSPGGRSLAATSGSRVLVCHHERGATFELTDPDGNTPSAVAASIDGRWLAIGDTRGWVRLWDARLDPAPWKVRGLLSGILAALRALADAPSERRHRAWDNLVGVAVDRISEVCDEIDVFEPQHASIGREIDWLVGQLQEGIESREVSPELLRKLRIELPLRPIERSLLAVQEHAAALLQGIGDADEAACQALLERARECRSKVDRVIAAHNALPPEARASADAVEQESAELAAGIAAIEDRVVARQAMLAIRGVSPIEDHAAIDRMRGMRIDVVPRERAVREGRRLSSRKLRAVGALTRLDRRESVLRGACDELARLRIEIEAIEDVKKLRT